MIYANSLDTQHGIIDNEHLEIERLAMNKNYALQGAFWDGFRSGAKWLIIPSIVCVAYFVYLALQ